MPSITLTVTAKQATRALKAIGAQVNEDGSPANAAQAQDWLMRQVKAKVLQYETGAIAGAAEATKRAELVAEGW